MGLIKSLTLFAVCAASVFTNQGPDASRNSQRHGIVYPPVGTDQTTQEVAGARIRPAVQPNDCYSEARDDLMQFVRAMSIPIAECGQWSPKFATQLQVAIKNDTDTLERYPNITKRGVEAVEDLRYIVAKRLPNATSPEALALLGDFVNPRFGTVLGDALASLE